MGRNPNNSCGGRGGAGRGSGGQGRGHNNSKRGLCPELGSNVFDFGPKASPDQMKASWEKVVIHMGASLGPDISNELGKRRRLILTKPTYSEEILDRHRIREPVVKTALELLQDGRKSHQAILERALTKNADDGDAIMKLAALKGDILKVDLEMSEDVPVQLTAEEQTQFNNDSRTHRDRDAYLVRTRGKAYSLVIGQCTHALHEKMKQDPDWPAVKDSHDPLVLYKLIEKTILGQTEDQYPCSIAYDQEISLYGVHQEGLTNATWSEHFDTKLEIGDAIGVSRSHTITLEFVVEEVYKKTYASLDHAEQVKVQDDADERYKTFVFLKQSGKQHNRLRVVLANSFTIGKNHYPKNRQAALHLLDRYGKDAKIGATTSEGNSFLQEKGDKPLPWYSKERWKDKQCHNCLGNGHPSYSCPNETGSQGGDDSSVASTRSAASANSFTKLNKEFKKMAATLAQLAEGNEINDDASEISDISTRKKQQNGRGSTNRGRH